MDGMWHYNSGLSSSVPTMATDADENDNTKTPIDSAAPMVDPQAIDDLLSREMQQLSFQERSSIQEEIHGVRCLAPEETPLLLQSALQQLDLHLKVSIPHKPAYELACSFPKTYVDDIDFKLKFLRAELLDPWKAANRMVKFLELVREVFGEECLQRPVTMGDLGVEATEALRCGQWQSLPCRDRAGRRIFAMVNNMAFGFSVEARVKLAFYLFYAAVEDEESQRKGIIFVVWPGLSTIDPGSGFIASSADSSLFAPAPGFYLPDPRESFWGKKVFESLPIRPIAFHMCFPDTRPFRIIRTVVTLVIGRNNRTKIQKHDGDRTEILYGLLGYGIPIELIPITETGNVKTKNLSQWLKVRKVIESSPSDGRNLSSSTVECPRLNDVVFRFGTSYMCHPGNVMFLGIIECKIEDHANASQEGKKAITWSVIEEVEKERKGRFLSWDSKLGSWTVLTDRNLVRSKIAVCFREQKKRSKARQNPQVNDSSTSKFQRQDGSKRRRTDFGNEEEGSGCFCG